MIVAKFGGAVLNGADGLLRARDEIRALPRPLLVVVSAFANVTNLLEGLAATAVSDPSEAERRLAHILGLHESIARKALSDVMFEKWRGVVAPFGQRLAEVVKGLGIVTELSPRTLDLIVHFGERLSSATVVALLNDGENPVGAVGVSALDVVITDDVHRYARPDVMLTRERVDARLRPALESAGTVVIEGYIARGVSGQATTMGRESSSYSGTILGELLGASEVRIYTDVPGILTADPMMIPEARTLPKLSYAMAHTLAELGVKVLHPRTVRPVERAGIRLVITKFDGAETVIDAVGGDDCCSIAALPSATVISLGTATANLDIEAFMRAVSTRVPVLWRHQFRRRVKIVTARPITGDELPVALLGEPVTVAVENAVVVSLVRGHGVTGGDLSRFFACVEGHSTTAMQGGVDARAVSVAVPAAAAGALARALHDRFAG